MVAAVLVVVVMVIDVDKRWETECKTRDDVVLKSARRGEKNLICITAVPEYGRGHPLTTSLPASDPLEGVTVVPAFTTKMRVVPGGESL